MRSLITDIASVLLGVLLAGAAMALLIAFGFIGFFLATLINLAMVILPTVILAHQRSGGDSAPWVCVLAGGFAAVVPPVGGFAALAGIGGMFAPDFLGYYVLSFLIGACVGMLRTKNRLPGFGFKNHIVKLATAIRAWLERFRQGSAEPSRRSATSDAAPSFSPPQPAPTPPAKPAQASLLLGNISKLFSVLFAVVALVTAGFTLLVIIPQSSRGTGFASALLLPAALIFGLTAAAAAASYALSRRFSSSRR